MKIHSTMSNSALKQVMKNHGKDSGKNTETEQKELDKEIQSLQQRKVALAKEIDNIKNDFAPPKPKEELIRPIKEQIQALDTQIQQKQMEKIKKQSEQTKETSSSDGDNENNLATKDIECKANPASIDEVLKCANELLKNFTTQNKVANEGKVNSTLNNSDVSNTSTSIKSIAEKKKEKYAKDAINTYNTMKNNGSLNSEINVSA